MDFFPTYQALLERCGVDGDKPEQVAVPMSIFRYLISRGLASIDFDEAAYLAANPDVGSAVEKGEISSGRDHYIKSGFFEARGLGVRSVDTAWYLNTYADVKIAVETGRTKSAADHFFEGGYREGRACSERYRMQQRTWAKLSGESVGSNSGSGASPSPALETIQAEISQLSQAVKTIFGAARESRFDDIVRASELLKNSQAENAILRERLNDIIHDVTIAWTRYSDLLRSVDRHYTSNPSNETATLRDVIREGILEAQKEKTAILKKKNQSATGNSDEFANGAIGVRNCTESAALDFYHLVIGDPSTPPRFTIICASDEPTVRFETLVASIMSSASSETIEVFAPIANCVAVSSGKPVDTGEGSLASRVNRLVLDRARAKAVAIVSAPGVVADGWMGGFEAVFDQNALAAGVNGIVLTDPKKSAWSGATLGSDRRWRLEDVDLPIDDYRLVSAAPLDHLAPGFVAIAPDIYHELDGFSDLLSLAAALHDFSNKAVDAGFEICRAPKSRLTLASEWRGRKELLNQQFETSARLNRGTGLRRRPRVLVVDHLTPKPDQDAGSMDIFWGLRILQSFGYEVTFIPMYDNAHAGHYTEALRALGVYCPVAPQLTTPREFIEAHGGSFELIILYRVIVAYLLIDACRASAPQAKLIFHTVDLHFLREERHADRAQTAEARAQSRATKIEELRCLNSADLNIIVSRHEFDLVEKLAPNAKKALVRIMHPVPGRLAPRRDRQGVLFVGGFTHAPNLDAVAYLIDEIWDLIRKEDPKQTLRIVGANVPNDILKRNDPSRGIEILGFVQDLRPLYARAMVNIAPLRFGAGIKGKVIAAMGVGLPVVATSVATEGMDLTHEFDVINGNNPREIAHAVVRLCQDEVLWNRISNNALEVAQAEFSVEAQIPRWRRMLSSLAMPT